MSTKNSIIAGKKFYIFEDCFEENMGVYIKFFQPEEASLATTNSKIREVEVRISREMWNEIKSKIKQFEED